MGILRSYYLIDSIKIFYNTLFIVNNKLCKLIVIKLILFFKLIETS